MYLDVAAPTEADIPAGPADHDAVSTEPVGMGLAIDVVGRAGHDADPDRVAPAGRVAVDGDQVPAVGIAGEPGVVVSGTPEAPLFQTSYLPGRFVN